MLVLIQEHIQTEGPLEETAETGNCSAAPAPPRACTGGPAGSCTQRPGTTGSHQSNVGGYRRGCEPRTVSPSYRPRRETAARSRACSCPGCSGPRGPGEVEVGVAVFPAVDRDELPNAVINTRVTPSDCPPHPPPVRRLPEPRGCRATLRCSAGPTVHRPTTAGTVTRSIRRRRIEGPEMLYHGRREHGEPAMMCTHDTDRLASEIDGPAAGRLANRGFAS